MDGVLTRHMSLALPFEPIFLGLLRSFTYFHSTAFPVFRGAQGKEITYRTLTLVLELQTAHRISPRPGPNFRMPVEICI